MCLVQLLQNAKINFVIIHNYNLFQPQIWSVVFVLKIIHAVIS